MREGYTYDDEKPSVQGSFYNDSRKRRNRGFFTGKNMGIMKVDPETKEIKIIRNSDGKQQDVKDS